MNNFGTIYYKIGLKAPTQEYYNVVYKINLVSSVFKITTLCPNKLLAAALRVVVGWERKRFSP